MSFIRMLLRDIVANLLPVTVLLSSVSLTGFVIFHEDNDNENDDIVPSLLQVLIPGNCHLSGKYLLTRKAEGGF